MAVAVLVILAVGGLSQVTISGWWFQDTEAYWQAATRLREGAPLYPGLASEDASSVYRYAPWFAIAWVPLTLLPKAVVVVAWTIALAAAAAYCAWVPLRQRSAAGFAIALVAGALLLPAAASGNVQPLLVAVLLWGVERRSGPVWIAAAASLKAAPLLLIAVYLGRREWSRAAATGIVTAILVAPMLLFDLSSYPTDTAAATGPFPTELALLVAVALAVVAAAMARTRYGWLAAASAVVFGMVRWSYYQPSLLLIGLAQRRTKE